MSWKARLWVARYNLQKYVGKIKKPRRKFTKHIDLWRIIKDTNSSFNNKKYNFFKRRRFYG